MPTTLIRGFAIPAISLWLSAGCFSDDTRISNRFDTKSAANAQEFFLRGWLPDVLPQSAGPIEEVHDLDTNARCSRSKFPPDQSGQVEQALQREGFVHYEGSLPSLPFNSCPFSHSHVAKSGLILIRRSTLGSELAAIDQQDGLLLFWSGQS